MRILFWTELFHPHIGGVEVFSLELIRSLQKRNYEFTVVTCHTGHNLPDESMHGGIRIFRFPFHKLLVERNMEKIRLLIRDIAELKKSIKPDIIHINSSQPSVFFHQHTHESNTVPVVFNIHEPPSFASGRNSLMGRMLEKADWVVAVSKAMLEEACEIVPEIEPRASVIYNALKPPPLKPSPLPFKKPVVLCIGRIVIEKGFDLAIDAFPLIREKFPGLSMVFAGDGPLRRELEQRVSKSAFHEAITFTGWIEPEKIPELINMATIILIPSRWNEPFGLVALQAAHMARPVVASRVGGLPEIIVQGKTGELVQKNNSKAIAESLISLLENREKAVQMGRAARKRALQLFDIRKFSNEYDALYQRLRLD